MSWEILKFLFWTAFVLVVLGAWVTGTLDPYQKKAQKIVLGMMGETKVSYGLKRSLAGKKLIEDKNLSSIQDQIGGSVGGMFGKRGAGESVGIGLSKRL